MQEITRAEYDRLRLAGEQLPRANYVIEPDGRRIDLFLTPGETVARTNTRLQSRVVRDAITLLADLTEHENLGAPADAGFRMPLYDLIESGQAYQIEHDAALTRLVSAALAQLERWLGTPAAKQREYLGILFRDKAEACVAVLRQHGF